MKVVLFGDSSMAPTIVTTKLQDEMEKTFGAANVVVLVLTGEDTLLVRSAPRRKESSAVVLIGSVRPFRADLHVAVGGGGVDVIATRHDPLASLWSRRRTAQPASPRRLSPLR